MRRLLLPVAPCVLSLIVGCGRGGDDEDESSDGDALVLFDQEQEQVDPANPNVPVVGDPNAVAEQPVVAVDANATVWPAGLTNANGGQLPAGTRVVGFHVLCYDNAVSGLEGSPGVLSVIRSSHNNKPGARPDQVSANYDEVNLAYYDPALANIPKMMTTVRETDCPEAFLEEPVSVTVGSYTITPDADTGVPGGLLFFNFSVPAGSGGATIKAPSGYSFGDGASEWMIGEGDNIVPVRIPDSSESQTADATIIPFELAGADGSSETFDAEFWVFKHQG